MNKAEFNSFIKEAIEKLEGEGRGRYFRRKDIYVEILNALRSLEPTSEEALEKVGELYGKNQYEAVAIFEKGLKSNGIVFDPTKIYVSYGKIFKVNEKIGSDRWKGYVGYRYIIKKGEFEDNFKFNIGSPFSLKAREANKDEILLFKQADACRKQVNRVAELRNAYLQEVGD